VWGYCELRTLLVRQLGLKTEPQRAPIACTMPSKILIRAEDCVLARPNNRVVR